MKTPYLLLLILIVTLLSCSNDDTEDSFLEPSNTENTLNSAKLSGKLFTKRSDSDNSAYLMDIKTGGFTYVPGSNWNDKYSSGVRRIGSPYLSYDYKEYTIETGNCKKRGTDALSPYNTCIDIYNFKGEHTVHIETRHEYLDILSSAKLSWDRQYIGFIVEGASDIIYLLVFDRSGNEIASYSLNNFDINTSLFEWLPDGRILIKQSSRKLLVLSSPYDASKIIKVDKIIEISDSDKFPGYIYDMKISPDVKKIAFVLRTGGNSLAAIHGGAYVMNIDGTDVRKLAQVADDVSDESIRSPKWSPDGKWILLSEGGARPQGLFALGTSPYLYVVPSDTEKPLTLSIVDSERSPEAIQLKRNDEYNNQVDYYRTKFSFEDWFWLP